MCRRCTSSQLVSRSTKRARFLAEGCSCVLQKVGSPLLAFDQVQVMKQQMLRALSRAAAVALQVAAKRRSGIYTHTDAQAGWPTSAQLQAHIRAAAVLAAKESLLRLGQIDCMCTSTFGSAATPLSSRPSPSRRRHHQQQQPQPLQFCQFPFGRARGCGCGCGRRSRG